MYRPGATVDVSPVGVLGPHADGRESDGARVGGPRHVTECGRGRHLATRCCVPWGDTCLCFYFNV